MFPTGSGNTSPTPNDPRKPSRNSLALDGLSQRQLLERARDVARPLAGVTRLGLHQDDSQWWLPALWPAVTGGSVILGQSFGDGFGSEPVDAVL